MKFDKFLIGDSLLLIGGVQWFLGLLLAESFFPGYSSTYDYVSDLGIGPTALIYNISVFILGACLFVGAYLVHETHHFRIFTVLLLITGIGAMGVGVFPANLQPMHSLFTLLAILCGGFSTLASFKVLKSPISYLSIILGLISIASAIVFFPYLGLPVGSEELFLGMAKGSMERWAIYPILAWFIVFGGSRAGRYSVPSSSDMDEG